MFAGFLNTERWFMLDYYPSSLSIGGSSAGFGEAFGCACTRVCLGLVATIIGATSTLEEDRIAAAYFNGEKISTPGPQLCYIEITP